jgi:hypothetical protein
MLVFSFGQSERERIEIDVLDYERKPVGEYYDDNWLNVEIRIHAGGFRGKVAATILTGELEKFLSELKPLYEKLIGDAKFTTMEEQLGLRLSGDGKGHIELRGEIADQAGIGNRLFFNLRFDQSQLKKSISELELITETFPVRSISDKLKK